MKHRPHVHVAGPWGTNRLSPPDAAITHLTKVLRYRDGDPISYTDGVGTFGEGIWVNGSVQRGVETAVAEPTDLTIAVAPPRQRDRLRFVIEKAQELGVSRLVWLETDHGEGRVPPATKSRAWAVGALEQSRGAWLMAIDGPVRLGNLGSVIGCDSTGEPMQSTVSTEPRHITVAIGPEGGWSSAERACFASTVSLGPTVLRVETAVVVAATLARRAAG